MLLVRGAPGAAAAALFGGDYLAAATGGGSATAAATAAGLMIAVTASNWFGVRVAGRVQLALAALLVAFLLLGVALAAPHAHLDNLRPFAPNGWLAIGPAAALLDWGFVGWEAITYLASEFRRPARDMPRATAAAVVVIGVFYLAVALAVIAVLGPAAGHAGAPLGELLATALGGNARALAAAAALLLTFGVMNTYYAGAAKLGAALGRDGALPRWLATGSAAGEVPRRSLGVNSALSSIALLAVVAASAGARPLVLVTAGSSWPRTSWAWPPRSACCPRQPRPRRRRRRAPRRTGAARDDRAVPAVAGDHHSRRPAVPACVEDGAWRLQAKPRPPTRHRGRATANTALCFAGS